MSEHKLQAKHISDTAMLLLIKSVSASKVTSDMNISNGPSVTIKELEVLMPHVPRKVLLAKNRKLILRGFLSGRRGYPGNVKVTPSGGRFVREMYVEATFDYRTSKRGKKYLEGEQ